ncbi:MAG: hypothetical protein ACW964_03540 [Candidatus Hodarchaeales archaeon]
MRSSRQRKRTNKSKVRREQHFISQEAMIFLLEESLYHRLENPHYSRELYYSAQKIGQRSRLHLPKHYRFLFCKSCKFPFNAKTARIRLNSKKKQIHYQCLICKHEHRVGYGKDMIIPRNKE